MASVVEFSWGEDPIQVLYLDVAIFIFGADVSDYLMGQVNLTINNRNGHNTANFVLANPDVSDGLGVFVYSPEQAIAVRQSLDGGQTGQPDTSKFRTGARDYRYSELAKFQIASRKAGKLNSFDKEASTWRWEPHPGATCFDKFDPIRIFLHDPRSAESDTDTPAWIPVFTGFLENRTTETEEIMGENKVMITAHDIRYFLTRMRTDVSFTSGQHMGNGMVQISNTIFQDVRTGSRVGHALEGTALEDAVQHIMIGGTTEVGDDGRPKPGAVLKKSRQGAFTGIGYFKLGRIVEMVLAPSPVAGAASQKEQLTDGRGGNVILTGNDSTSAQRRQTIEAARKKVEDRNQKLLAAQAQVAKDKAQSTGQMGTATSLMAQKTSQDAVRAAQQEVTAAKLEFAQASATIPADQSVESPALIPADVITTIPEAATDLPQDTISLLEEWYANGLFGDWEDDLKLAAQMKVAGAVGALGATGALSGPLGGAASALVASLMAEGKRNATAVDAITGAAPSSPGARNAASAPAGVPSDVQKDADGNPLRDSVTGEFLRIPGGTGAADLTNQSRSNPATTTTSTTQSTQPAKQNLVSDPSIPPPNAPAGASGDAQRAAAGAGNNTPGDSPTQNGPATYRPLTWKEVQTIGEGTYWDGPFDPTSRRLFILIPKGGTGNRNFADQTSPQSIGFHDRYFISRAEVINGFLAGIDYQWWVSGPGDIFVEPNMLDFQPEDFGQQFAPVMSADAHLIHSVLGDEHGDIPTVVQAVGAANNPLAGGIATAGTVRSQVGFPLGIRRYGIEVRSTSYPWIASPSALAAAALVDLQKFQAHANNADIEFVYRPFLLPNKPFRHRPRFRMGTTTMVNHTITIFGVAQTRVGLDFVRRLRYDGRYLLLTGGYDAPIGGRRILPADTLYGPPRTGARTDQDAAKDPNLGMVEKAGAKDLVNPQIAALIAAEKAAGPF